MSCARVVAALTGMVVLGLLLVSLGSTLLRLITLIGGCLCFEAHLSSVAIKLPYCGSISDMLVMGCDTTGAKKSRSV